MDPTFVRALVVVVLLAAAYAFGRWWRARDGVVRDAGDDARLRPGHLRAVGLDLADAAAGAVLLGSPTCAPCDSVKRVLGEVASERSGFRWVYADAGDHLDLAEEHRVMRVPTLFVLAPDGRILARTSGVPRPEDLRRVLDQDAA